MSNPLAPGIFPCGKQPDEMPPDVQQQLYRLVIDTSPDVLLMTDVHGCIFFASKAATEMFELESLEQFTGTNVFEWVEPEDQPRLNQHIADAAQGILAEDSEYHLHSRLGKPVIGQVNAALLHDSEGNLTGFVANIRDVTEQRQASRLREVLEAKFRHVVEANPLGMHFYRLEADRRLILENANPAADQILHVEHGPLLGKTIEEAFPGLAETTIPEIYRRVAGQGDSWHADQVDYDQGVIRGAFEVVAFQISPGHMVASFNDITERKRAEQALHIGLEHMRLLGVIDRNIIEHEDIRTSLEAILKPIQQHFQADAAEVLFYHQDQGTFQQAAQTGFVTGKYHVPFKSIDGMPGQVLQTRKTLYMPDLPSGRIRYDDPQFFQDEHFQSGYSVLLQTPARVQGVLQLFYRREAVLQSAEVDFLEMVGKQVAIAVEKASNWENHQQALSELSTAYEMTLQGLVSALDLRDNETEHHTRRVTDLSIKIAKTMGISTEALVNIRRGAMLHDIGKIGIPDQILRKPGALSDAEWEIMKRHPDLARRILLPIEYLHGAIDIPYCHHERLDGSGYPRGLKGDQIPLAARIFAVADVWDALTSDRPYRAAWPKEKAAHYLQENSGILFDPGVVRLLMQVIS